MKLTDKMAYMVRDGVKTIGGYNPHNIMPYIAEELTAKEYDIIEGFLTWVYKNKKTFGWNIQEVFNEYKKGRKK